MQNELVRDVARAELAEGLNGYPPPALVAVSNEVVHGLVGDKHDTVLLLVLPVDLHHEIGELAHLWRRHIIAYNTQNV